MKNTRASRDAENRNNEMIENYSMDYVSPLMVPDQVKKEGYNYSWVRKEVKGEADYRVEEASTKGWTPVPVDRAGNFAHDPLERNPLSKRFVTYKDLLLMERPTIYSDREERAFNQLNANKINSLRGVTNDAAGMGSKHNAINSF